MTSSRISLDRIARAAREIDPVFLRSPQFRAESLGASLGADVVVKVEAVNPIRSFKGRGADFFVRELADASRPLACASAGNFGQGLAYAARRRAIALDVFAAVNANPLKIERMRALGARVHLAGHDFDAAKAAARDHAARHGARYVEDGREVAITEGAGTIGVELATWPDPIDVLLVPLGNGALLGGMPLYKYASNRALTLLQNLLGGHKLSEYHTGYRAYSRQVLTSINFQGNSDNFIFDNQFLAQILYAGFRVGEITCPTRYADDSSSISFRNSVRYGLGVLGVSLELFLQRTGLKESPLFAALKDGRARRAAGDV